MKSLPLSLILEKNKISTDSSFIVLLEITLLNATNTVLRLAANEEDIILTSAANPSVSKTYTAFPFELDLRKENAKGQIPTVLLRVSNITREIQVYLDALDGGIGSTVKIIVVNSDLLDIDYTELEITYDVIGAASSEEWAVFTLGTPSPLRQRHPQYRYLSDSCNWVFKGVECAYSGGLTTCGRTFAQCQDRNNTARYGGFRGLRNGSVRIV